MSNGLPLPWTLASIGNVHAQSDASGDALAIRLLSSGVLAGTADSGLFAWQTLSGDGEITVRIRELENTDTATRIGLMIRESLAPNSKHTFIGTDGRGYVRWIRRTKAGGNTSTSSVAVATPLGLWLRLNREGTTVSAFTSSNGTDWTRVGRVNVDLGTTCYFGLSAHSGSADKLSAAVFENITVTP
jgi:regulation of enolase protein 1 (concanavalin A-like superfamily)